MKNLIITIFLFLSACSWSLQDKVLFGSYFALSTIDTIQTSQMEKEYNPLLQKEDGSPDMGKVIALKAVSGLGIYFLADYFENLRTPILIWINVLQGGAIIYNNFAW